ncbi:DUF2254 domain-containing protein [Microbacterium aoyamense]|uniref:DUF2254 domain-containing protein n=1 Tax=Microbacterium aoyamense TaxID=344166 RepID=A0ABN2PUC2_9MICO|nr:DUF2254 domain-containing protein [Microbacterium aoyamense]
MWFRSALFVVIAIGFALAAGFIGAVVPFRIVIDLGQNSVGSLLQIIATAMLTATTFSVTAMVTAYSSATTTATPRATQLLVEDPTSQNALSTFVGAFVFSMVGIIALSTGYYTEQGRTILFLGTLVVIAIVVITLLRWIAHLANFGRMSDVIDRVERAASESLIAYAASPTLGARRLETIPRSAEAVWADEVGYVVRVDVAALDRLAVRSHLHVYVNATPGRSADALHPLAYVVGRMDDESAASLRGAFRIAAHRDYEQDPRLGIIALSEIGSRALSPATNDPGTAVEVIAAFQRVFSAALRTERDDRVRFERVWIDPPRLETLAVDGFRPLARDGAAFVEVQIRMQKCLAGLREADPKRSSAFETAADDALERARAAMARQDFKALRAAARSAWATETPPRAKPAG